MSQNTFHEEGFDDQSHDWEFLPMDSIERSKTESQRMGLQAARKLATHHASRLAEGWFDSGTDSSERYASLDDQQPATLYYLDLVRKVPKVTEVYVEPLERGRIKHWTVLAERDYDAMEAIYEIEDNTLDHFPGVELRFRVTVESEDGPSTSSQATKIYPTR